MIELRYMFYVVPKTLEEDQSMLGKLRDGPTKNFISLISNVFQESVYIFWYMKSSFLSKYVCLTVSLKFFYWLQITELRRYAST